MNKPSTPENFNLRDIMNPKINDEESIEIDLGREIPHDKLIQFAFHYTGAFKVAQLQENPDTNVLRIKRGKNDDLEHGVNETHTRLNTLLQMIRTDMSTAGITNPNPRLYDGGMYVKAQYHGIAKGKPGYTR